MNRVLNVLNAVVTGKLERRLQCEACGKEFICGASLTGCWCSEVKLSDEQRADLRSCYSDCLCRNCLERVASDG
ncbi:MAG: hypothetical protein C5B55_06115 [Blastocatellia bacterium]|nr:MAG: hypothetical protein C5B55_06115 [Blastocatellia bacterium]